MSRRHDRSDAVEPLARVLDAWASDGMEKAEERGVLERYLGDFRSCDRHSGSVRRLLAARGRDANLLSVNRWIIGRSLIRNETTVIPVATARIMADRDSVSASIRVALLYPNHEKHVHAIGLRFDSPERYSVDTRSYEGPHAYPHMQFIEGWTMKGECLVHPPLLDTMDDRQCDACSASTGTPHAWLPHPWTQFRPAVPLRCNTLGGLAVAALAAIYGTAGALAIIEKDQALMSSGSLAVRDDIGWILGLEGRGALDQET